MDPNVFRKGDAKSVLVVETPWDEITGKPVMFDELADRIRAMHDAAEDYRTSKGLTRKDSLMKLKIAIRDVLIYPLTFKWGDDIESDDSSSEDDEKERIKIDALWKEIPDIPEDMKKALEDAYLMWNSINKKHEGEYLTDKSTLWDTKGTMNETVLKPLLGIEEDD